jgi:hypothetical protein
VESTYVRLLGGPVCVGFFPVMLKMEKECDQEIQREKDRGRAGSTEVCCQEGRYMKMENR